MLCRKTVEPARVAIPMNRENRIIPHVRTRCGPCAALLLFSSLLPFAFGCHSDRFVLKTQVKTELDFPPVSVSAGNVKPIVVQQGPSRIAIIDVDGLILNTPFVGPLSCGENPVALVPREA